MGENRPSRSRNGGAARHVALGSAPSPRLNQQAGNDKSPIPTYSGERSTLLRSHKRFYRWALSHQSEDALNHSRPVLMTAKKFHIELEKKSDGRIVD